MRRREGLLVVLLLNVFLGVPAYFISFLFAYGFEDEIGLRQHVTFLVLIAVFAVVTGVGAMAFPLGPKPRPRLGRRVAFGIPMSLAVNLAVVGLGSIVSAQHKAENSVSADFSTQTDVLVATGLFVVAIVFAVVALRVDLRPRGSQDSSLAA